MTDVLYYDGRCDLCASEIRRLRRLKAASLELADIHALEETPVPGGPDRETLLRTLHLRKGDGRWLTGADANVEAWRHTRYGWLWTWLRWAPLRWIVDPVYRVWARWRYRRLYGKPCAAGRCDAPRQR